MTILEAYSLAVAFSENALRKIVHTYKVQTYLELDSIPMSVAEDLIFLQHEKKIDLDKNFIARFCKYHTLHLATCDRKHRSKAFNPDFDTAERTVYKTGFFKPILSLQKMELVKSLTLQGKKNDEIMELTGFSRSTVCYLQKESGVKCVNSRIQYTQEQVEEIRSLAIQCTAKEVGRKMNLTEQRVRTIASKNGIHFYHIGGAPKREKVLREDEIIALLNQGVSGLQVAKRLGVNQKTVYKVASKIAVK